MSFWIDVESGAGLKLGSGPITSASQWRFVNRMSRAGSFDFVMPASDPKSVLIQRKRVVKAYAMTNGQRVSVGSGIIDRIEKQPQADGNVVLRVSGDNLLRELSYRSVLNLKLYVGGNAVSHAVALAAVAGFAPAGWTFTPDGSPPNDSVYGYFGGESVLAAILKIAEKSQNQFWVGADRTVTFASSFAPSGVRAIQARGNLSPATCAIVSLTEQIDTYDLITRIYPRGSGNAEAQLTLRATSRSAPIGFTLNTSQNYIESVAGVATYGIIERQIDFRDIGPVANTDADIQSASDMLFDAALETLTQRSTELEQATYTVQVAGCSQLLRPMQSIRLVYRDTLSGLDINNDLNILESTWQVDTNGIFTTALRVSNADRWPRSDVGTVVDGIEQGNIYQALPQLNANSYVTAYTHNVDESHIAAFRFRFGDEVTQLQQVLFEFQILSFESTVKAVGGASSGSGDIPTDGPSTNSSGSGGNNDSGSGGPTTTDSSTPTIGSATPTVGLVALATDNSLTNMDSVALEAVSVNLTISTVTPVIGNATPDIGNATPTIGSATPTVGSTTPTIGSATPTIGNSTPNIGSTALTSSGTGLTTNDPEGGDVDGSGFHQHAVNVIAGAGSLGNVTLHESGGLYFLSNPFVTGSEPVYVTPGGLHTHDVDSHTHSISSHNHTIAAHDHTIASHSHTIASHSHTMTAHTHTLTAHTHTIATHDHTIAAHTHTIAAHSHTVASHTHFIQPHSHFVDDHTHSIAAHTHTLSAHTHTISAHTHSLSSHTHSLNNHTHDLSESIEAIYGIFRESPANTYVLSDLDYRVNGGTWFNCEDDAVDAGDDWWQIDITSLVMDSVTFRPNQSNNILEIRSLTADKTATIDAQLSVRNIIQAIAFI